MEIADSGPRSIAEKVGANGSGLRNPSRDDDSRVVWNGIPQGRQIPESLAVRAEMADAARRLTASLAEDAPITRQTLEHQGRRLLKELELPESCLGFAMVLLGNAQWKRRFLSVPFARRLILLPHHLSHTCDGGDDAETCNACRIAGYQSRAEQLGYMVLVTERSPAVLSRIIEENVDAILGIASLDDLEKAIDRVLFAGVPSFAVPLAPNGELHLTSGGPSIEDVLERHEPLAVANSGYVRVMRAAASLFKNDFARLLPRVRSLTPAEARSPLGLTEDVAYDWLANGGKRFRPFITLAAYEAARGEQSTGGSDFHFPDSVCRVAMAIEAFHKASLVHDDIQDDDLFRYGRETLHRSQGLGPAINIGDYLIGLGYRLVNSCRDELGADVAVDIVDNMSQAHLALCDGQGAEMAWNHRPDWSLTSDDAIQIYALKTSPAFEAALYAGLRMVGPVGEFADQVSQFCRHLGIGFQVLNDLKDWCGDQDNKLIAGQDALALRPTVLLALAIEAASDEQKAQIRDLLESDEDDAIRVHGLRTLFMELGAFRGAHGLVARSRASAEAIARNAHPEPLRHLLEFLIETVLAGEPVSQQPERLAVSSAAG